MISSFHSVVIDVRAFDVGVRDYSLLLGLAPTRIEEDPAAGTRSAFFGLSNMALEVRAHQPSAATDPVETFGLNGLRLASRSESVAPWLRAQGLGAAASEVHEGFSGDGHRSRSWHIDRLHPASSRGLPVEIVSRESAPAADEVARETRDSDGAAGAGIDPEARVRALDHVVVLSPDPESTRAFYAEGLGLRLALDRSFEDRGVRLLFFRVGGTTIEIGGRLGADPRPDRNDRFGGLAWQVPNVEAIASRLLGENFDVSEVRDGHKKGTRVCTVRDRVHGVPTLLIEPIEPIEPVPE